MVRSKKKPEQKPRRKAPEMPARRNQVTFAPSILASDFANLERELKKIRRAGCPWAHIDVMDGRFVPNLTLGPPILRRLAEAVPDLFYDAHLMIVDPLNLARDFIAAGASNITIHLEACDDPVAVCRYLRRRQVNVGVSIRPKTSLRRLKPVLGLVDLVLIMTVEPGFGGQELIPQTLNKVRELKQMRDKEGLEFLIQVDGGIKASNVRLVATSGAEVLVMGTAIFDKGQVIENVRRLRRALVES
jgi:ribulose-phosphate 3-epimerase